jgi:dinuclear metal center YbgI/SA1388 family protein
MKLQELVRYLDSYLRVAEIEDSSQNGLQVEGPADVEKLAFAVDSSLAAIDQAVAAGAQLLVVHHGLLWGSPAALVGPFMRRVKSLILGECGLYASHLPLDLHPEVGNNAELARLLDLKDTFTFGKEKGVEIGVAGALDPPLDLPGLIGRLVQIFQTTPIRVLNHGPETATRVGCISGFAADLADQAEAAGLDTYITGETSHAYFHEASERGLNIIYAGHYTTETLGVKALARHIETKYGLDTVFLDNPTGM